MAQMPEVENLTHESEYPVVDARIDIRNRIISVIS